MFDTHNTPRLEAMAVSPMQVAQLARVPNVAEQRESAAAAAAAANGGPAAGVAQSLGIREADDMMKKLVEEGWFEESRKGFFTLSPRALMELRGWLVATYNDDDDNYGQGAPRIDKIKTCLACKDIITVVCFECFLLGPVLLNSHSHSHLYLYGAINEIFFHRANDVPSANARVVSTTSVHRTSSAANRRRHVQFANRNGLENTLWANGRLLLRIGRQLHGGRVDVLQKELAV